MEANLKKNAKSSRLLCRFYSSQSLLVFIATVLIGLLVHGMRFGNMMFSHDSLLVYQNEASVQISLGRFLQPFYVELRGMLCSPWLIGLLALFYTGLAAVLIVRVLRLRHWAAILLTCCFLTVNAPFSYTSATYIPWLDIFMLSLLFCALSVTLFDRFRFGFLLGAIPLCIALGLYQSYFQAAVGLFMLLVIREILDGQSPRSVLLTGIKAVGTLILGLLFYYIVYQLTLLISGVAASTSYNGLSGVGNYSDYSILSLIIEAYRETIRALFVNPETYHSKIVAVFNLLLFLVAIFNLVCICRHKKIHTLNLVLLLGVLALFPLGINVVYIIAKGIEHALMTYSFTLFYLLVLLTLDRCAALGVRKITLSAQITRWSVFLLTAAVLWCNTIYTEQLYLKKELCYESTMATMNRIVDRIEQTEGYVIGETPVAFIGNLDDLGLVSGYVGYEEINGPGFAFNAGITYYSTYQLYFQNVLGYPIVIASEDLCSALQDTEEVQNMQKYPAADCCKMVDGVLVVKLK